MIPDENRESDIDPKFSNIQSSANTLSSFQEPESSIKSEKKYALSQVHIPFF